MTLTDQIQPNSLDPQRPSAPPFDSHTEPRDKESQTPPPNPRSGTLVVLAVVAVVCVGVMITILAWAWTNIRRMDQLDADPLPIVSTVPHFSLTTERGDPLTQDDLLGKVWVADFIFTGCAGPCPELSARMRSLQYALRASWTDVRLISFSVDPERDTPPVLQHYAKRFNADPARWHFLTGYSVAEMRSLVTKGFLQTVAPAAGDNPIVHSNYFVLVDRAGKIRAFHDGMNPDSKPLILNDLEKLLRENSP